MGLWLLWTVITTALGILVVRIFARAIWRRLEDWKEDRPTLHEFLGRAFSSPSLKVAAALCTSLGFLGAFAVELTVGTKFLGALIPSLPLWIAVLILALIGVSYTALGGFRAVIVTDRIQMRVIWLSIAALVGIIWWQTRDMGGINALIRSAPAGVYDLSWRDGLTAFLLGIFVINVPTFLADMSVWQRIAATRKPEVVTRGLLRSVLSAALSWGAFVLIACALVSLVPTGTNSNILFVFLRTIGTSSNPVFQFLFVVIAAGLYAASLSTASTQLVATAQTIHTDILHLHHRAAHDANEYRGVMRVRAILIAGAAVSVGIVLGLTAAGFTIADLVFAVYGAQLGLVPAVLIALFASAPVRQRLSNWAGVAVLSGFLAGWASAGAGTYYGNGNLTFLAPVVSLAVSAAFLGFGYWASHVRQRALGAP